MGNHEWRQYPQKLISLIERYKLYEYDALVLGNNNSVKVRVDQGVMRYIVEKGDTLYSISKKYGLSVNLLKQINNLNC